MFTCLPQLVDRECAFTLCACLFTTSGSVVFLEFSHNQEIENMENPLSKLELDSWYKVMIVVCTVIFLSTGAGLLPKLPTNETLLTSLGGIFLSCGEWKNHPRYTQIQQVWGQRFLGTGFRRSFSLTGTILCLIGFYLIYKGLRNFV